MSFIGVLLVEPFFGPTLLSHLGDRVFERKPILSLRIETALPVADCDNKTGDDSKGDRRNEDDAARTSTSGGCRFCT